MPRAHSDLAFVVALYGPKLVPFLGPHLHAIRESYPASADEGIRGWVVHHDVPQREILILAKAYPEFRFVTHEFAAGDDVMHAIPRKLHAWREGARLAGDRPAAFLDVDAMLVRPIDDMLAGDVDAVFTWKDEAFPINTGVMAFRSGRTAEFLLAAMLERVERTIDNPRAFQSAIGASGAADQHALRELLGFCNYDRTFTRTVTHAGESRELVVRGEPCRVFNETNCRAIDENLRVIHYKTGWHPILLQGAAFTQLRPQQACEPMFAHWRALEARSADAVARAIAHRGATLAGPRLARIAGGYEERGILHSEMQAVCGVCELLDVDAVIESGRARGQSTLVLARYFEDRVKPGRHARVVSVEMTRDDDAAFAESRLKPFEHAELLYGDANVVVPEQLRRFEGLRVALLLDGPKGLPALDLVARCFEQHPGLCAAFVHDMRRRTPQRDALPNLPFRAFCTDEEAYVATFGEIDHACLPRGPITMHTWRPYQKGEDAIPSYGPTLACLFPRPARAKTPATRATTPILETGRNP